MSQPSDEDEKKSDEPTPLPPRRSARGKRVSTSLEINQPQKEETSKQKKIMVKNSEAKLEEELENSDQVPEVEEEIPKKKALRKATSQTTESKTRTSLKTTPASATDSENGIEDTKNANVGIKKKKATRKRSGSQGVGMNEGGDLPPVKKAKAPSHQVLTERDEIPKLWDSSHAPPNSHTLKIASWNVAGLRAVLKKDPNILADLVKQHDVDILCLQETKLQEMHLDDPKMDIPHLKDEGYQSFYSCSVTKKGYSGTAVFVRNCYAKKKGDNAVGDDGKRTKKQGTIDHFWGKAVTTKPETKDEISHSKNLPVLENVSYGMGIEKHDGEGRMVVLDFSSFTLCNVYVPNSGQNLERLSYRTDEWDKDMVQFMQTRQKDRQLPVLWAGDLNVAHTHLEVWNDGAKHLPKQAGVTPEERASFQSQLDTGGFVDAFRRLHPTAAGHYSYWSTRAGNRPPNKGLRLDYFVCGPALFEESSQVVVRDSYMLYDQMGSDHCPVVLELEVKNTA